ncbi:hypothetical protein K2P96_01810 [Patescibacteria group bacterium]|nr:hypothetical protein [Patescibacteria group bacterium]
MKERFYPKEIIRDPEAKIKNFNPEAGGRDRFGNRIFTSKDLAYLDGKGDKTKAGLLVSPDGQSFLEKNKGILRDIELGIGMLETKGFTRESRVQLGGGKILEHVTTGGQSNFYVLSVNGEMYAIKTHAPKRDDVSEIHQPYINEMLQTQAVSEDLRDQLASLNVRLSTFLFASGQVSCTKFEHDDPRMHGKGDLELLEKLDNIMRPYIHQQQDIGNNLWENTGIDIPRDFESRSATMINNFRINRDGVRVWIDPFVYFRPD